MDDSGMFLLLLLFGFSWLFPLLNILFSSRTRGAEKLGWLLAVLFISWLAWIIYLIVAPVQKR